MAGVGKGAVSECRAEVGGWGSSSLANGQDVLLGKCCCPEAQLPPTVASSVGSVLEACVEQNFPDPSAHLWELSEPGVNSLTLSHLQCQQCLLLMQLLKPVSSEALAGWQAPASAPAPL